VEDTTATDCWGGSGRAAGWTGIRILTLHVKTRLTSDKMAYHKEGLDKMGARTIPALQVQKVQRLHICPEVVIDGYDSLSLPAPFVDLHLSSQQDKHAVQLQHGGCRRH
jgi:hypothetical protein